MRRNAMRSIAAVIVGAFMVLLPGMSAASAAPAYPPPLCATVQVSTTVARVGETIEVTGVNFVANATVTLALKPAAGVTGKTYNPLKSVKAGVSGSFSTTIVMPPATTNGGNFILFATTGAPNNSQCPADPSVVIRLSTAGQNDDNNPGTTTTSNNGGPGSTAFTGVNVMIMLLVAAGLIVVGVAFARRGRSTVAR